MPRRAKPSRPRAPGTGTYWYDAKTKQHCWRIVKDGQRHTVKDPDPERAQARFVTLCESLKAGADVVGARDTLTIRISAWMDEHVRHDVGVTTYANYVERIEYHILPTLGSTPIRDLTPVMIQRWVHALGEAGVARTSQTQALSLLKRYLDYAVTMERLILHNPASSVKIPRARGGRKDANAKRTGVALTPAQIQALRGAVAGDPLAVLYELALTLGLRRGELLGVRIADVLSDPPRLTVAQQVNTIDGKPTIRSDLKTARSYRVIPLSPALDTLLRQQIVRVYERRLAAGSTWQEHGLLFPSEVGTPISPRNLLRHFAGVIRRAGLPTGLHFHDLRHTASSAMDAAGIRPVIKAAIMGHTVEVNQTQYTHPDDDSIRAAIDRIAG